MFFQLMYISDFLGLGSRRTCAEICALTVITNNLMYTYRGKESDTVNLYDIFVLYFVFKMGFFFFLIHNKKKKKNYSHDFKFI